MHLRYINKSGEPKDIELTGEPISIGRSREADIPLLDDKVSRVHCGIRLSDGNFYLKDLKSRNGTFVNGSRVDDSIQLKQGDRIQIGSTIFVLEAASRDADAEKAFGDVQGAMGDGKGYSTILKEIVEDIEEPKAAAEPPQAPAAKAKPAIRIKPTIKISTGAKKTADGAGAPPAGAGPATGRRKIVIKR